VDPGLRAWMSNLESARLTRRQFLGASTLGASALLGDRSEIRAGEPDLSWEPIDRVLAEI
jgi:hypothetical protein